MLDQLREAPVIARRARNGGVARRLDAVYYDTPDCSLHSQGWSLRVRRSGKGYVQTLKRGPVHGEPFTRGEWEMPVEGFAPDLALLPVSEIGAPLDGLAASMLDPIFVTRSDAGHSTLICPEPSSRLPSMKDPSKPGSAASC